MFIRSVNLLVTSSLMAFLALLSVILRFAATGFGQGYRHEWLEDLCLILSLLLALGICVCIIIGASVYRFGNHELYNTTGPDTGFPLASLLLGYGKLFFVIQILHCCCMPLIKASFLMFLHRTFRSSRSFRIAFWIISSYIALWWLTTFWMTVFQCWPITSNWGTSESEEGNCIPNYDVWYAWAALLNVLSDFAVTVLPLPEVWKLRVSTKTKISLTAILSAACIVTVAGIGRTVSYFQDKHNNNHFDFTYNNYWYLVWTPIEPCLGVMSICVPRLRLLFVQSSTDGQASSLRRLLHKLSTIGGSKDSGEDLEGTGKHFDGPTETAKTNGSVVEVPETWAKAS